MFGFFKKKQPPPNDLTHQVANSVSSLLSAQLMMCQSSNKIGDNWTIGYIGGFIDQVNIRKGIKHDERGIGVMLLVFGSVFGDKNRVAYFNQYESLILSEDGRPQKLSATPDLSGTVLPLCPIPNSALKNAPPFKSVMPKASACAGSPA